MKDGAKPHAKLANFRSIMGLGMCIKVAERTEIFIEQRGVLNVMKDIVLVIQNKCNRSATSIIGIL